MNLNIPGLEKISQDIEKSNLTISDRVVLVDINKLMFNPNNFYDLSQIEYLKESIKVNGLIEPLIISEDYVLISGHRRLKACLELEIDQVNCRFGKISNKILSDIALIEANSQRIKTKKERDTEINKLSIYYKKLKETNPDYQNININKILANKYGVSKDTIKRAGKTKQVKEIDDKLIINKQINKTIKEIGKLQQMLSSGEEIKKLDSIIGEIYHFKNI